MRRRTRKNPLATAKDLTDITVVDVGGGNAQLIIGGVAGPVFPANPNAWSGITGKPAVIASGADAPTARAAINVLPQPASAGAATTWTKYGDYLARPTNPCTVVFGDSLSAQCSGSATWTGSSNSRKSYVTPYGYFGNAMMLARQPGTWWNAGIAGNTTTQMLARFDTDVTPLNPQVVVVEGGYNDPPNFIPSATTASNLRAIFKKAWAIGAVVIYVTPPPGATTGSGSLITSPMQVELSKVCDDMRAFAANNRDRLAFADLNGAMINPLTGQVKSGYTDDAVHPNSNGGYWAGIPVKAALQKFLVGESFGLPLSNLLDANNLMTNGMMTGTGGNYSLGTGLFGATGTANAVIPTGLLALTNAGTDVNQLSRVYKGAARADGYGDWLEVNTTLMPASGYVNFLQDITTGFAAGDIIQGFMEFEQDAGYTPAYPFDMQVICRAGSTNIHNASAMGGSVGAFSANVIPSGVMATPPIEIPPTTDKVRVLIYVGGTGIARIGRCAVRKLTPAP